MAASLDDPHIRALLGFPANPIEAEAESSEEFITVPVSLLQDLQERIEHLERWRADQAEVVAGLIREVRKETPKPSKKTLDKIDKLYQIMSERKTEEVSISQAAFLLKISRQRMNQLKKPICDDSRFASGWSKTKGMRGQKGAVIRIHQYIK